MNKLANRKFTNSLKTFLVTGSLGKLTSYPTRYEVEYLLGVPTATDEKSNIIPDQTLFVLYYNNLQFTYIGEEFYQLAIYFRKYAKIETSPNLPNALGVDWYQIVSESDYESFKQFLLSEGILCRRVISPYPIAEDGYTIEIISTGIWLCFNNNPDGVIDSIFYTPSKPGQWQYTEIVS